jgi:hypothetical protein
MNELKQPLLYVWEKEFGTPEVSIREGHEFLWGGSTFMVTANGKSLLSYLNLPFEFLPTQPVKTELSGREYRVENLSLPESELFWARPTDVADADPEASDNKVCDVCGTFTERVVQLTRLRLFSNDATSRGAFTVRQNHGGPVFVTEDTKKMIGDSGIKGVGFYPAGKIL